MKVINLTSLPDAQVRALLRLARGRTPSAGVLVAIRRGQFLRGRYYPPGMGRSVLDGAYLAIGGRTYCNDAGYITIYLPRRYPLRHGPRYGCEAEELAGWQEALVHLAAHEFYHHRQYLRWRKRGRSAWPSLGQNPAEKYAGRRLVAWRKTQAFQGG